MSQVQLFRHTYGFFSNVEMRQNLQQLSDEIARILTIGPELGATPEDFASLKNDGLTIEGLSKSTTWSRLVRRMKERGLAITFDEQNLPLIIRRNDLLERLSLWERFKLYRGTLLHEAFEKIERQFLNRKAALRSEIENRPFDDDNPIGDLLQRARRFQIVEEERINWLLALKSWDLAQKEVIEQLPLLVRAVFAILSLLFSAHAYPFTFKYALRLFPRGIENRKLSDQIPLDEFFFTEEGEIQKASVVAQYTSGTELKVKIIAGKSNTLLETVVEKTERLEPGFHLRAIGRWAMQNLSHNGVRIALQLFDRKGNAIARAYKNMIERVLT